jgi:hypothetical protein
MGPVRVSRNSQNNALVPQVNVKFANLSADQTMQARTHALTRARTKDIVSDCLEIAADETSNCASSPRNVRSSFGAR